MKAKRIYYVVLVILAVFSFSYIASEHYLSADPTLPSKKEIIENEHFRKKFYYSKAYHLYVHDETKEKYLVSKLPFANKVKLKE